MYIREGGNADNVTTHMNRVLIVDADDNLCGALRYRSVGKYDVVACVSFKLGLQEVESNFFDIIIAAYRLPDGFGMDLSVVTRNKNPCPFILIMPEHSIELKDEAERSGVQSFLWRPFKIEVLQAKVDALLSSMR